MTTKTKFSNPTLTYSEQRALDLSMGTRYMLRAECRGDCQLIMAVLAPWILSWYEASGQTTDESYVDVEGKYWSSQTWGTDTDVQFVLKSGAPSLNEVRWLINMITDCHVAAQTVEHIATYTGERMHFEILENSLVRPNKALIESALKSIVRESGRIESRCEQIKDIAELLQAHIGNPESYMRKEASRAAQMMIENKVLAEGTDPIKLADFFFNNMTFNASGTHISIQMS